jgi:glycerol-1-phosphate dehydrogenase [NAD(P)+]
MTTARSTTARSTTAIEAALPEARETRAVALGQDALSEVGSIFHQCFGTGQAAVVVADSTTYDVAGRCVEASLRAAGLTVLDPYIFPSPPTLYARYENVERLCAALATQDAVVVAVGSGTLNDLAKRASGELHRPYMVVATAASMDGYAAFGASIAVDGYKQTLTCPAPVAVVADAAVLAAAPPRLAASGYGDLAGKITAGADWLIADALGIEPINQKVWDLVQGPLWSALDRPQDLLAGSPERIMGLTEGLFLSGLAMQMAESSRPASGSEHQFSHLWEMEGIGVDREPPLSHGFKVAVGSVAILALYELLLADDLSTLDPDTLAARHPDADAVREATRQDFSHPGLRDAAIQESLAKHVDGREIAVRVEHLRMVWPHLKDRLAAQLIPAAQLQDWLRAVGAPTSPADIGLSQREFHATYRRAQRIRRRYTVLDLALELGRLDDYVAQLFAPTGFWATR